MSLNPYQFERATMGQQAVNLVASLLENEPFNGLNPNNQNPTLLYPIVKNKLINKCESADLVYGVRIDNYKTNLPAGIGTNSKEIWLNICVIRKNDKENLVTLLVEKADAISEHLGGAKLSKRFANLSLDDTHYHPNSSLGDFVWGLELIAYTPDDDKCGQFAAYFIAKISCTFK